MRGRLQGAAAVAASLRTFGGFYVGAPGWWPPVTNAVSRDRIDGTVLSSFFQVISDRAIESTNDQGGIHRRPDRGWNWQARCTVFGAEADWSWRASRPTGSTRPPTLGTLLGLTDLYTLRCPASSSGFGTLECALASWWTTCLSMSPVAWRRQGSTGVGRLTPTGAFLAPGFTSRKLSPIVTRAGAGPPAWARNGRCGATGASRASSSTWASRKTTDLHKPRSWCGLGGPILRLGSSLRKSGLDLGQPDRRQLEVRREGPVHARY